MNKSGREPPRRDRGEPDSGPGAYNAQIIRQFRANNGRVGGPWTDTTLVLVHHVGARSGIERVTPLASFPQGGHRYVIVASNGGSPKNPEWYRNLKANPRITLEVGTQTFEAVAERLDDTARAELWPTLVAQAPQLGEFQRRATRRIPVIMLTPVE